MSNRNITSNKIHHPEEDKEKEDRILEMRDIFSVEPSVRKRKKRLFEKAIDQ